MSDPLDDLGINVLYKVQLGAGRLNVARALTEGMITQTLKITSENTVPLKTELRVVVDRNTPVAKGGDLSYIITAGSGSATVNKESGELLLLENGMITLTVIAYGDDIC